MDLEELSFSLPLITFRLIRMVFFLCFACTPVEGQSKVIGSLEPIVAAPGDDVILPCQVVPPRNVARLTVEWSKPDLRPDPSDRLSRVNYVHLYRDTREVLDMKLSSYIRRTVLSTAGLRRGDISLKIINVTLADEGRYKCFIPKLKGPVQFSIVRLVVEQNSSKTWTTETPLQPRRLQTPDPKEETGVKGGFLIWSEVSVGLSCVLLIILTVVAAVYLIKKCQKQKLTKVPTV